MRSLLGHVERDLRRQAPHGDAGHQVPRIRRSSPMQLATGTKYDVKCYIWHSFTRFCKKKSDLYLAQLLIEAGAKVNPADRVGVASVLI